MLIFTLRVNAKYNLTLTIKKKDTGNRDTVDLGKFIHKGTCPHRKEEENISTISFMTKAFRRKQKFS